MKIWLEGQESQENWVRSLGDFRDLFRFLYISCGVFSIIVVIYSVFVGPGFALIKSAFVVVEGRYLSGVV